MNGFPAHVASVRDFASLLAYEFSGETNAVCWSRELSGDFAEIERALPPVDDITSLDRDDLIDLKLSAPGQLAREHLLGDLERLTGQGLQPSLDLIPSGPGPRNSGPVRTDVGDWHVDSANVPTDTYLCTYHGAPTEGIPHDDGVCRPDDPSSREMLLRAYGGRDDGGFEDYLAAHFYDLHYAEKSADRIFSFGPHHLWRIATRNPFCPVPPCIHRAPATTTAQPRRLLLIS